MQFCDQTRVFTNIFLFFFLWPHWTNSVNHFLLLLAFNPSNYFFGLFFFVLQVPSVILIFLYSDTFPGLVSIYHCFIILIVPLLVFFPWVLLGLLVQILLSIGELLHLDHLLFLYFQFVLCISCYFWVYEGHRFSSFWGRFFLCQ